MDAHATAASSGEKRKHKNEDNKDDERSTKRSQPKPSGKTLAGCSKSIDSIEQISVYTAVTKHGRRGTLLIDCDHEALAVGIDLKRVLQESDPTGHLAQTLKDAKMPIDKKIVQGLAQQNDLLTQKINLIESELSTLRSEIARLTELVETGASTVKYPKPTSTHQGFRDHENRSAYRDDQQPAPFSRGWENPDRRYQEESLSYRQASEARVAPSNRLPARDTADSYDEHMRAAMEDWNRRIRPQSRDVSFNPDIPRYPSNAPLHSSQANLSDNPASFWAPAERQGQLQNIERGWEHRTGPGRHRNQSDTRTMGRPAHDYGLRSRKFDG